MGDVDPIDLFRARPPWDHEGVVGGTQHRTAHRQDFGGAVPYQKQLVGHFKAANPTRRRIVAGWLRR